MLKPYIGHADKLTKTEADVFEDVIHKASVTLSNASTALYRARYPEPNFGVENGMTPPAQ